MKTEDYIVEQIISIETYHDGSDDDEYDGEEQTALNTYHEILDRSLTDEENKRLEEARKAEDY